TRLLLVPLVAVTLFSGCNSSRSHGGFMAAPAALAGPPPSSPAPVATTVATASPPLVPPTPVAQATLLSVTADEFAGGFGNPPAIPIPPPPPTISFAATFSNTGPVDLLANDPSLAVEVRFADPAAPSQVTVKLVALTQSLPRGMQGKEAIDVGAIAHLLNPVQVTCTLVRIDPATGAVVATVSAPQTLVAMPT